MVWVALCDGSYFSDGVNYEDMRDGEDATSFLFVAASKERAIEALCALASKKEMPLDLHMLRSQLTQRNSSTMEVDDGHYWFYVIERELIV